MDTKRGGRPKLCPDQEDALENYTARLSFKQVRFARKLGGGNFSEGLRKALEQAAKALDEISAESKKPSG